MENLYWGDLHSHCAMSYGRGTLERSLRAAREHLDFCSVTGHATWPDMPHDRKRYGAVIDYHREGFERLRRNWTAVQRTIAQHDQTDDFVALLSYEWHSLTYGDHNVYFPGDEGEIVERDSLVDLWQALPKGTLLIPHHIGYGPGSRGIDWDSFEERITPLVEMFSTHGCSERDDGPYPINHTMGPRVDAGTVARGLALGKRFGMIGSTDHHGGYPGHYGGGRTAVFAPELSRSAVLEALRARRCYAVTGDKIVLDFHLNEATMGGDAASAERREVRLSVTGCNTLNRVEVVRNNRTLKLLRGGHVEYEPKKQGGVYKIRLEWGWGEKNVNVRWEGEARIEGGELLSVEPCFRGEEVLDPRDDRSGLPEDELLHRVLEQDSTRVSWFSHTAGNPHPFVSATSGLILEVNASPSARLDFDVNGERFGWSLEELLAGSRKKNMRGWLSEVFHVQRAMPEDSYRASFAFVDEASENEVDFYYLRVAQENGQWAWSSPIWVPRE